MKPIPSCLAALAILGIQLASQAPPAPEFDPAAKSRNTVLFDDPGDGLLWAGGRNYKMCFTPAGTSFIPVLGPRAPHNLPFHLRLAEVLVDGTPMPLDAAGSWHRTSTGTLQRSHGALTESWRLEPASAEQDFELPESFPRGDVLIRLRIDTGLAAAVPAPDGGLWFAAGDLGGVHYGDTVLYDGAGRRLTQPTRYRDGHLELSVPATFLQAAEGPVVVDPIVRSITVDGTQVVEQRSDVAYSAVSDVWLVVYEEVVSAIDRDLYSRLFDRQGNFLRDVPIEMSTSDTICPAVASHRAGDQFMVVWEEIRTLTTAIRGRTVQASSGVQGALVSFATGAHQPFPTTVFSPDIGGTEHPGASGYYVVWTRSNNTTNIEGRSVSTSGVLGSPTALASGLNTQSFPAISKSAGPHGRFMVVYTERNPISAEDVFCAVIDADGTPLASDVPVTNSRLQETHPDVAGDGRDFFLVWSHEPQAAPAIHGRRFRFENSLVSLTGALDLTAAEPRQVRDVRQHSPRVAGHGCRFTYTYVEEPDTVFASVVVGERALAFVEGHLSLPGQGAVVTGGLASVADTTLVGDDVLVMATSWSTDVFASLIDPLGPANVTRVQTGCGVGREEPTISLAGEPALGASFTVSLFVGSETPFLFVGIPTAPQPLCSAGCALGVQTIETLPLGSVTFAIPCAPDLLGAQIGFQGLQVISSLVANNRCGAPQWPIRFRTTDTLVVTLR